MSKAKFARPRRASTISDADYDRIRAKTARLRRARRIVRISADTHRRLMELSEAVGVPMTKLVDSSMNGETCRKP